MGTYFPYDDTINPDAQKFQMDGPQVLKFVRDNFMQVLEKVQPGLSQGKLGTIVQVIPHQASGNGLKLLERIFGREKIVTDIFPRFGNTIACGIPCALYEAIEDGRVKRGDDILMVGSSAGVSFGAMKLTF